VVWTESSAFVGSGAIVIFFSSVGCGLGASTILMAQASELPGREYDLRARRLGSVERRAANSSARV
jgi:hypothetical protein